MRAYNVKLGVMYRTPRHYGSDGELLSPNERLAAGKLQNPLALRQD
jgi:hypothetical protein